MRRKLIVLKAVMVVFLVMACNDAGAEIRLSDTFSVTGFARYEIGIHTAGSNPNLAENHDLSLSKFFLQTEWYYEPTDVFDMFVNIRVQGDTTYHWDSDLDDYNAFPFDVPDDDWTMMKVSEDDWRAEVWEVYADITLGDLWLRLGKQQIAWGEMIGARFLDAINAVDLSWNMFFEPEEFEIIRIPNWSIRGIYNLSDVLPSCIEMPSVEVFVTPGDVNPDTTAAPGAPFQIAPAFPSVLKVNEKDRRGNTEYGVRVGGKIGGFYGTLNYLSVYSDAPSIKFTGLQTGPLQVLVDQVYPKTDLYGMSLNYAFADPYNLVITFEGVWSPNQPYEDAGSPLPAIRDQGTWKYAINVARPSWLWPKKFLGPSMTQCIFQFSQTVVEGDEDKILLGANKIDKHVDNWVIALQQPLIHNTLTLGIQAAYDPDDAYLIKPSVNYDLGDYWYFDIFATFLGGSEKRVGRLGNFDWMDTVYGRITYQF